MNVKLCEPCFAVVQKHLNMTTTRLTTLMCGPCRLRTRTALILNGKSVSVDKQVKHDLERFMKRRP